MKGLKNEIFKRPESRHSSRPDVFYFFPTAHFLKTILASRTNGTFGFTRHTSQRFKKPKEPFLATAPRIIRILTT